MSYLIELIEQNIGKKARIEKRSMQQGDVLITYANINNAKDLLGWAPKIKIDIGIKRVIDWLKKKA